MTTFAIQRNLSQKVLAIHLISDISKNLPIPIVDSLFFTFQSLLTSVFDDPELIGGPDRYIAFNCMDQVIAHCSVNSSVALLNFLNDLMSQIPDSPETRQSALLGLIARIVQTIPNEIVEREDSILALLFTLLQNRSPTFYKEGFVTFSAIIQARPERSVRFAGPFLEVVHAAFESGIPSVIGIAALAFGDFCKGMKESALDVLSIEINFLIGLLNPGLNERDSIPNLLQALGLVLDAVGVGLGIEKVMDLWRIVIEWGNIELDMDLKSDRLFASALFDGVGLALASLVKTVNEIEGGAIRNQGFVRVVKRELFPIVNRIWKLKAYSVDTLFSVCTLVETLVKVLETTVNVQLSSKAVSGLLHAATITGNRGLTVLSNSVAVRLRRV